MSKSDNSNLSTKLKAIELIVKELKKLDDTDRTDVIVFALKQVGLKDLPSAANTLSTNTQTLSNSGNQDVNLNVGMDKFVSTKKPQDQYQRVAVIAYYREHKENKKEFKSSEMAKANTLEARQPRIANISVVINRAQSRYKFLTKGAGAATHQLSTLGSDVVEALPDQEKVKALLAEARSRKSQKKKKSKK